MLNRLKQQWFFVGIAVVVACAFAFPGAGLFVREYSILKVGIFLAFLVAGVTLDTSDIVRQLKQYNVLLISVCSSLILFPLATYCIAGLVFRHQPDFIIGSVLIALAPVTIASGTVMTGIAGGNIPLSLFICVLCNTAAVFTIPPLLNIFVSVTEPIDLPVLQMILSLVLTVFLPITIGQIVQSKLRPLAIRHKKKVSIFNQTIVLLIIFNAVAGSTLKLIEAGPKIVYVVFFVVVLHNGFLAFNYHLAKLMKLDQPSIAAFAIHTSQKTLTVSYLVWSGYLASAYPMALIPCIAYHLTQSVCDTVFARYLRKKADRVISS